MAVPTRAVAAGAAAALGGAVAVGALRRRKPGDPAEDLPAQGFARHSLATPTGAMTYYEAGPDGAPPLVFLHGIGGGASSWTWSRVAPAFTGDHRVVVPDWVGWGLSEHPRRRLLFDDYVAQLDALLGHLGEPAVVVAQSLAAGFAAEVARTAPERFVRLVMMTPSGGRDFGEDPFGPVARRLLSSTAGTPAGLPLYRAVFHRYRFVRSWLVNQGFYDRSKVTDQVVQGFLYFARRPGAAYSALPFLTGELRYDMAPYLRDLKVPAVMIWGAAERQVGVDVGARLAALNPDIPFRLLSRARATPELELPDETVALLREVIG